MSFCASQEPHLWAEEHCSGAEMSDVRRTDRIVAIAEAMAATPGGSIPTLFAHPYDIKAAYNLFKPPDATPDNVQAGHRDLVLSEMHTPGVSLLLEETTELSFSGRKPVPGLGPIGNGAAGFQGFFVHSVLGVRWSAPPSDAPSSRRPAVAVGGLCDQQSYVRKPRAHGTPRESSQARKYRERESYTWEHAGQRSGPAPAGVRWIRIGDREADIYEHLRSCQVLGQGFVMRAAKDRAFCHPQTGERAGRLFEVVRRTAPLGEFVLEWRARPQQPARRATLLLSATAIASRSPWRPGDGLGRHPRIQCPAVRVWEGQPDEPEGLEGIWLGDAKIASVEQARAGALPSATRWLMEVFQSQDIKFTRAAFFFLVGRNRLFFKGQYVMHFDRPIGMHHNLFHQQLDYRLSVLKASLVDIPPQQRTKLANIVRDVCPLNRRVALLCQIFLLLLEPLEPLSDLLAAGRQIL